jgi:hypothetical protein
MTQQQQQPEQEDLTTQNTYHNDDHHHDDHLSPKPTTSASTISIPLLDHHSTTTMAPKKRHHTWLRLLSAQTPAVAKRQLPRRDQPTDLPCRNNSNKNRSYRHTQPQPRHNHDVVPVLASLGCHCHCGPRLTDSLPQLLWYHYIEHHQHTRVARRRPRDRNVLDSTENDFATAHGAMACQKENATVLLLPLTVVALLLFCWHGRVFVAGVVVLLFCGCEL